MNRLAARTIISVALTTAFIVLIECYYISQGFIPQTTVEYLRAEKRCSGTAIPGVQRTPNASDKLNTATLNGSSTLGHLNYDVWKRIVGFVVDDLRIKRDFPQKPTLRNTAGSLRVEFNEYAGTSNDKGMYGHRLYGVLHPPVTGEYSFVVEMTRVTCSCSVELWLSTNADPVNSRKVLAVEMPYMVTHTDTPTVQLSYIVPGFTSIRLDVGSTYYFEFLEKAYDGMVISEVKWRTPEGINFTSIPPSSFAMAVELDNIGQYVESPMATALLGPLPSLVIQGHRRTHFVGDSIFAVTQVNVLPTCEFKPEYVSQHNVSQYKGIYEVFESSVYPADDTLFRKNTEAGTGNSVVKEKVASDVIELYKKAFDGLKTGGEIVGLHYMEETKNKQNGSRFLLEMDIMVKDNLLHTSEYVYLTTSNTLCYLSNFQWTPNTDVYLVITLKNLGQWFKHLVNNLEDLYAHTHDDHFELVVVDFISQDIDIKYTLEKSSLKRWALIQKAGKFSRSAGLQAGINYVTDPNSIVMTIDMHLTLPVGFVEYTRRHVIQGKMGYAPMFFRLGPGYTEININGFWEVYTYGIYALCKSDWTIVGGFNVEKYTKWGGEDWDVLDRTIAKGYEMFRIRHPGLVHYYHTRDGLWGN